MKPKKALTISLTTAKIMALLFFGVGTLLFLLGAITGMDNTIVVFGFLFIVFAIIFNAVVLIILFVDLIRKDQLESFIAIVITLVNIPIAVGYFYLLSVLNAF